jgi:hypothetical protein
MLLLRAEGFTLAGISWRCGLTRQAVQKALDRLGGTGIVFAPVVHRLPHTFHAETDAKE